MLGAEVPRGDGEPRSRSPRDGDTPPQDIDGDIAITHRIATITLDGVHTTEVDVGPILVR